MAIFVIKETTMPRILFLLILTFSLPSAKAQQTHFIYIQTENKQPFYIRYDKKIYSSSVSGYLIIPKLTDGNYDLQLGFPRNEWPEQDIHCAINKKDIGYLLKNFGEKGWGFMNMQNSEVLMAVKKDADAGARPTEYKTDAFSNVLSNVVNDPSIRQKDPVTEQEAAKATEPIVAETTKKEMPIVAQPIKKEEPVIVQPVKKEEPIVVKEALPVVRRSEIGTLLKTTGKEGTQLIYVDRMEGAADTIRIFIPADNKLLAEKSAEKKQEPLIDIENPANVPEVKKTDPAVEPIKPPKKADKKPADKKFIDMELPNPNSVDTGKIGVTPVTTQATVPVKKMSLPNTDCKASASEDDFLKLRKKMAAADNDEVMVTVAKKVFKAKCFSTEQVKNLSVLFLKDKGKYDFFEAAYPFVSDSGNFPDLQAQLTEEYFITRFKAMVRH